MVKVSIYKVLNYCIAMVWIINGLYCKVLNFVPRHEQIVGKILSNDYARPLTLIIGLFEVVMGIWVLIGFRARLNAVSQMAIVAVMNTLEFILVPDLLLWGKLNSVFALLFIIVVYMNEFHFKRVSESN